MILTGSNIVWQSKLFPKLVMTEQLLEVLRRAYPAVKHFEPEMRRLEVHLFTRPAERPKRNWNAKIDNWMKKADEIARRPKFNPTEHQGDATREMPNDPKLLVDIMNKSIAQEGDRL